MIVLQRVAQYIVESSLYRYLAQRWRWLRWLLATAAVAALAFAGYVLVQARVPVVTTPAQTFGQVYQDSQRRLRDGEAVLRLVLVESLVASRGASAEASAIADAVARSLRQGHQGPLGSGVAWAELDPLLDQLSVEVANGSPAVEDTIDALIALLRGEPEPAEAP